MGSFLTTLFWFILALGLLIAIHEYGHFIVARKTGVKVLKFSIGFGKPIWSRIGKDGVEYVIAMLPLGGYVKMLDEREGDVKESEKHLAFNRQSLKVRSAIVAAGPVFNLVFAIFALWILGMIGENGVRPWVGNVEPASIAMQAGIERDTEFVQIGERPTPTWDSVAYAMLSASVSDQPTEIWLRTDSGQKYNVEVDLSGLLKAEKQQQVLEYLGVDIKLPEIPPVFGKIVSGEPADKAGILKGDKLLSVNGKTYSTWQQWVAFIRDNPDTRMALEIERGQQILAIDLSTSHRVVNDETIGRIGAAVDIPPGLLDKYRVKISYGVGEAFTRAVAKTWDLSVVMLKVMGQMITGQASMSNLSGPISIAQAAGNSAEIGLDYYLKFLALVSISLGVLNLLPIPILDGGHLFWYLIEAIKGSEVSESAQLIGQKVGLFLLLSLMSIAFYVDISRLFE